MRRIATAIVVALLPAACASDNVSGTAGAGAPLLNVCLKGDNCVAGEPVDSGTSLTGNFLAGRHAQSQRDMSNAADFLGAALKISPDTPDLLRQTFVLMCAEGRMDEAIVLARRVIEVKGEDSIADILLAVDDIKNGRFVEAEERMTDQKDSGISLYMAPLLQAWSRVGLGQPAEDSVASLKALDKSNGSQALHDLHTALINDIAGNTDAAEESYKKAVVSQGGLSLRLTQLFGSFFERAGKSDEAKALYLKYLETQPNSRILVGALARVESGGEAVSEVATAATGAAEGLFGIAGSLSQQNVRETALVLGRMALHLKPDFPVMQILVADILESHGRLEKANQMYGDINPDSPFAWSARQSIAANLDELERTEEAIKQLNAMADAEPDLAEPLIKLGNIMSRRERFKEAVIAFDRAIERIGELTSKHWSLLYSRGIALERSKNWPRAEADFLKALEFKPEQPFVLNYLGYSWVDQGLHLDRAMDMIKRAVELRPSDGYIVDSLGWVLYRLGKYDEAVKEMERAVELRPEDPVINDHLGDTYWQVGRKLEARFQWRRALSLDPEDDLRSVIETKIKKGLVKKDGSDG